jgi:pimeloyl-ACP methyl ester carboxylesterase
MAALTNAVILRAASLCRDVYAHERDYIVDNSIPGFTIIAVEGTSSAGDWLTNIKFLFRNDDTHRGFKENAMRLVNQLFMREQIDFKTQLVVCGHSLGGATATVLADMLRQGAGRNVCVITLGSPRPGGRRLRKRLADLTHMRYVHSDDVVPLSPLWLGGYVHTHEAIRLADANGDKWFDGVSDHDAGAYCTALALALAARSFLPWEGLLLAPFPCLVSLGFPGWCCNDAVPVLDFTTTALRQQVTGAVYLS